MTQPDDAAELESETRVELERARVQLQLIDAAIEKSLDSASAIGGELRLALRIQAIRRHKL